MNAKILVTYATRCGSTADIAQAIGQALCERGASVAVLPVKAVTDVSGYTAVVAGSAIRYSQWLPEAVKFLEKNQAALARIPTAFFAAYLLNQGDDLASRTARLAYLDSARKVLPPTVEAFFAGVGDSSKLSFLERLMAKGVKSPEGDFRDWAAINAWTDSLAQNGFLSA